MKKINKIITIALIFMLTGVFLCQDIVYSSDLLCLRLPMRFNQENSNRNAAPSISDQQDKYKAAIAGRKLIELKKIISKNISEIEKHDVASILVDRKTGEKRFFKEGDDLFVILDADVYMKEGGRWDIPEGVDLPHNILEILNNRNGAFVFTSGPFYDEEEGALTDEFIRPLRDEEIYERFGLRRVVDNGKPFTVPVLGIGGRAILLPFSYSVDIYKEKECHVFGLEFKNAGTPGYKRHNLYPDSPTTIYKQHIGKPGIFLNWLHQIGFRFPIGLGKKDLSSVKREKEVLQKGGGLTRFTLGTFDLFDEYGIVMRAPLGDYRRLIVFFDADFQPDKDKFYSIIKELYPDEGPEIAVEKYLIKLARNYGGNLKALLVTGILQEEHGSLINTDIEGLVADLDDYGIILTEAIADRYVGDWINNILKVIRIPEDEFKDISGKAFKVFIKSAAEGYSQDNIEIDVDMTDIKKITKIIVDSAFNLRIYEQKLLTKPSARNNL